MQTSLRRKREPLPAPNPPLFRPHADPAHRARVALCRSRSCRAPRIGPDHRVGLCAFPAASNPRPQKPVSRPCRLPVRSTRPMPGVSASTHLGTITPLDTDAPLLALHRHFADQLTSIRYWSAPRPLATPLLSHTHAHAHSRSSRVPRSVQETCNCTRRTLNHRPTRSPRSRAHARPSTIRSRRALRLPHGGQLRLLLCEDRRSNPPSTLTPTDHRPTHPAADDRSKNLRPKRNIRTAMNHEIMLYGIAQKVCGEAVTNRAYPHPDLRSPLFLAASQEQLGFDVHYGPLNPRFSLLALPTCLPAHPRSPRIEQKAVEECKYRMSRYGVTPNSTFGAAQTRRLLVLLLTAPRLRPQCL